MTTNLVVQYLIVAIVVAISALVSLRKLWPSLWGRGLAAIADWLEAPAHSAWLHAYGSRLRAAIPVAVGTACASSGSCNTCGACAPAAAPPVDTMPLAPPRMRSRAEAT